MSETSPIPFFFEFDFFGEIYPSRIPVAFRLPCLFWLNFLPPALYLYTFALCHLAACSIGLICASQSSPSESSQHRASAAVNAIGPNVQSTLGKPTASPSASR